ncbi:unnamed protein product, partial [Coregonus sp. 'balchen']
SVLYIISFFCLLLYVILFVQQMFLQRRSLQQELCEFCHKHSFGAVVAMTISFNERSEPHRQLAVYSSSTLYREEVSQALEKARNPSLSFSPMSSPFNDIKSYLQGNALASRKKVLPILKDFLKEWDKKQVHCGEVEDFEELDDHVDPTGSPGVDDDARPRCFSASRHHRRRLLGTENSGTEEDFQVPATPMNSLVEGCPLDAGLPRISAEAILEKFSRMGGEAGENKDGNWPVFPDHKISIRESNKMMASSDRLFGLLRAKWFAVTLTTSTVFTTTIRKRGTENLHSNNMEQRQEMQEEEKDMYIPRSEVMVNRLNCLGHLPGMLMAQMKSRGNPTLADDDRPAPPSSLALMGPRPRKKRLVAPGLRLTLDRSDSAVSDDYTTAALISSPDDDDLGLDIDLDAIETPSDSESLQFPAHDMDLEDYLLCLGVASRCHKARGSIPEQMGVGCLDQDQVDSQDTRWRRFCTGDPPQESLVNMSVLEPYLMVLSHGGYYGDGSNDLIVFSSCYLPENTMENYQHVMDNLFRYVVGTLDLMVAENYVIVYLCAMAQRNKLPTIGWLRECYTTIDKSSKFSRKFQFIDRFRELSQHIPIERVQIPDCVRQ